MKKKTRTAILCAGLALCMSVSLRTDVMADNAFVVEEEAIIGGESLQEGQGQTEAPAQMPPVVQEPVAGQKHAGDATKSRVSKEKKAEETEEEKKEEISQEQEESEAEKAVSVSQNTGEPLFRVPIRESEPQAPEGKAEEKELQPPEIQEEMRQAPEPGSESATEQENPPAPEDPNPWWMLAVGGVFFLGGCARFLWRLRDKKK